MVRRGRPPRRTPILPRYLLHPVRILSFIIPHILWIVVVPACSGPTSGWDWLPVARVIDGDTIELVGGERVRLLGLDAPELGHGGREPEYFAFASKAFLEQLVLDAGGELRLEYDRVRRDIYGRTLAYLWMSGGGFVNEIILPEGYAVFHEGDAVRWRERLRRAAEEARHNQRGLWHPGSDP